MATCILIGVLMLAATTVVHGATNARRWVMRSIWTRHAVIAGLVVLMFMAALFES